MTSLVSVKIPDRQDKSIEFVKSLDGYKDLYIDEQYGVVTIDPFDNLYAIRVRGKIVKEQRKKIKAQGGQIFSDPQISI